MNQEYKQGLWKAVRPLHAPITKALRRKLGSNYFEHPEMDLPPAYEAVQLEVERRLHRYLHVPPEKIEQVVIVGANDGSEIRRLRRSYPNSHFLCFEPSPQWYTTLTTNFRAGNFVDARRLALSDHCGVATFHELPLGGNGSLLQPDRQRWSAMNQVSSSEVTTFDVQISTLDEEASGLDTIDLLWVDVQGAEGLVLQGGLETLPRIEAIFLEVALVEAPYQGAFLFPELDHLLTLNGFSCVGLGIDCWNYSGNALWIRNLAGKDVSYRETQLPNLK